MGAPCVRGDHDQLKGIQSTFSRQADEVDRVNKEVKSCMDTLKQGDWIGKGATAFYAEMEGQILPAMNKLHRALGEAGRITGQISQVLQDAETEASNVFVIVIA